MYAQLGTTIFDGLKSFSSFSNDEDVVIVEHALIGRRATLQATAIGLRNLNINLFLHQEFCDVREEIEKLRNSKNTFEILPLLWGNGRIEGDFVIMTLSHAVSQMDNLGNTISATVNLSLKENFSDDKITLQQQQAQKKAFAVGDKKPPSKSTRTNPVRESVELAKASSAIKSSTGTIDTATRKYTNNPGLNSTIKSQLEIVSANAKKLFDAYQDTSSQLREIDDFATKCADVQSIAEQMIIAIQNNTDVFSNPVLIPDISIVKTSNDELQTVARSLTSSMNNIIKASILRK